MKIMSNRILYCFTGLFLVLLVGCIRTEEETDLIDLREWEKIEYQEHGGIGEIIEMFLFSDDMCKARDELFAEVFICEKCLPNSGDTILVFDICNPYRFDSSECSRCRTCIVYPMEYEVVETKVNVPLSFKKSMYYGKDFKYILGRPSLILD